MLHSIRRLALSFIRHFPVLVTLIVVLFAGGVALMWARDPVEYEADHAAGDPDGLALRVRPQPAV